MHGFLFIEIVAILFVHLSLLSITLKISKSAPNLHLIGVLSGVSATTRNGFLLLKTVLSRVHTGMQRKTTQSTMRCHACCKRMLMYAKYVQEMAADNNTCDAIAAGAQCTYHYSLV